MLEVAEKKEKPTPTPIASRRLPPHTVALTALSYFAASLALVAFSLFATTMDDLLAVSDADEIMPPKSTWFEPKLRDGFLVNPI